MRVCPQCVNIPNGRITHKNGWKEIYLDGVRVVNVHYAKSKRVKCDECGNKSSTLYSDDHWALKADNKQQNV